MLIKVLILKIECISLLQFLSNIAFLFPWLNVLKFIAILDVPTSGSVGVPPELPQSAVSILVTV